MAFETTTDEVLQGVSLAGKVAVVTGASAGLGVETVRSLAAAGAEVVMLARDEAKLEAVRERLAGEVPVERLHSVRLDLADLDQVRRAAEGILRDWPRIHLLINNAGVMACPLGHTRQGFEMQLGTNHVGHFLLTVLLAPALQAAAEPGKAARVVNLSSAGHRMGGMHFEDPNYRQRAYDKWEAYGQSKTANVLFTVALDTRLRERGVRAFAVHPGAIGDTELGRHMDAGDMRAMTRNLPEGTRLQFKTSAQGAATSVWAATAPELEDCGGLYLEDCHVASAAGADTFEGVQPYATDPEAAEQLWALSVQWTGEDLT